MTREIHPYTFLVMLCLATGGCKGEAANGSGEQTGSAAETNGTSPTDTGIATSGGEPSHEICDRYVKCIAATMPDALPPAEAGFGEGGTCWEGGTEAAQLCIEGCRTGLQQYHNAFPDELKCYACMSDAECDVDAGEFCFEGSCGTSACGNSIVEAGEICDSQPLCFPDCQGPADCSPVTGAGCTDSQYCGYSFSPQGNSMFEAACKMPPKTELGVDADCTTASNDVRCAGGLTCVEGSKLAANCKFEYCCTPFCDITIANTCPADSVCKFWPDVASNTVYVDEGLDYVGVCVAP
jgi:hypothetical protein